MSGPDRDVVRGNFCGVPFFAAETPPPFLAGLTFRVGRADETAASAGLTHLVEHLVLPPASYPDVECNGMVENLYTTIWASGPTNDVRTFLEQVVGRFTALPLERLDVERRILLAEEEAQPWSSVRQASALRFGPIGHGLTGYGEFGLRGFTEDDVIRWTAERFTAGNAAIWMTDPSFELDISLPPGTPWPAPEPRPAAYIEYPCVYRGGQPGGVLLSMMAERSEASAIGFRLLERRLRDRIRYELGLSYDVSGDLMPLTADAAHAWIGADVSGGNVDGWCDVAVRAFDTLVTDGPAEDELESEKARMQRRDVEPARWAGWLAWTAERHLLGEPYESRAESRRAFESVTRDQIGETLAAARSSLLLLGPEDTPVLPGFAEYPLISPSRIDGRRHRPSALAARLRRDRRRLTVSPAGVSLTWRDGSRLTARYDSTVLCFREETSRTLLTDDGFFVHIDAEDWTAGKKVLGEIDAAIPPDLVVSETPLLDARVEEVGQLARSTFKRTWMISDELRVLPGLLEDGEVLLVLAKASRGWKLGLLALTDRRLHFVYGDGTKHSFVLERGRIPAQLDGSSTLKLFVEDEWISLPDVEPKEKAAELEQLLGGWAV